MPIGALNVCGAHSYIFGNASQHVSKGMNPSVTPDQLMMRAVYPHLLVGSNFDVGLLV
jgi:hypothetical protein